MRLKLYIIFCTLSAFCFTSASYAKQYVTPTQLVANSDWPRIEDDLKFQNLNLAINRQLEKFKNARFTDTIVFGGKVHSTEIIPLSLMALQKHSDNYTKCLSRHSESKCHKDYSQAMSKDFNLYAPIKNNNIEPSLFTAYHTPFYQAKIKADSRFKVGIHSKPVEADLASKTRNEINYTNALNKYAMFFIEDYFDQYLLHIQGGGKVIYKNANGQTESTYLSYAGTNRQSFRFISRYMQEMSYIDNPSNESQRNFLNANPDKQAEIYAQCPSYVFFKISPEGPHGNDSVVLTDHRSLAADNGLYAFKGSIAFVKAKRPIYNPNTQTWVDFSRFFIDHDTGGAIKGPNRADLYFGEDEYASLVANSMKQYGEMYFFVLKSQSAKKWQKIWRNNKHRY